MGTGRARRGTPARVWRGSLARARRGIPVRARRGIPVRARRDSPAQPRRGTWAFAAAGLTVLTLGTSACTNNVTGDASAGPGGSRVIGVVAAENFWGSLVSQLGGSHVQVLSIVSDPNADPHDYESSAQDARAVAVARYVVQNGVGYDDWMSKLLAANPEAGRRVYDIGATLGKRPGDNPHLWYNPAYVTIAATTSSPT